MIAILSDIHGNLEALNSVINDILKEDFSVRFIFLGDLVDYGADSVKVIETIYNLSDKFDVFCLKGNHEDSLLKNDCSRFKSRHGVESFMITRDEIHKRGKLLAVRDLCLFTSCRCYTEKVTFCHGLFDDMWSRPLKVEISSNFSRDYSKELVVAGHSHIQGVCTEINDYVYLNVGSVGQPRNGDRRAQYVICDDYFREFEFRRVDYDAEAAAKKILDSGRSKFLANRLLFGI